MKLICLWIAFCLSGISGSFGSGPGPSFFRCEFPSFEEPSFTAGFRAFDICSNSATPNARKLCLCQSRDAGENTINFADFVQEQCDSEGEEAFLVVSAYDLIMNSNLPARQKTLALATAGLTMSQVELAKQELCACVSKLRRALRDANDPLQRNCEAMYDNNATVSPSQLFRMNLNCPQIGCCAALVTLERNVTRLDFRTGRLVNEKEQIRAGGVQSEVTQQVCNGMRQQVMDRVQKCVNGSLVRDGAYRIARGTRRESFNASASGSCDAIKNALFGGNELEEFGQEIKNYNSRMCNQADLYDDLCVDSYIERRNLSKYRYVNGEYEIDLPGNGNLSKFSYESDDVYPRIRVRISDLNQRIGRIGARNNSDCELDSSDSRGNVSGEVEYLSSRDGSRVINRIRARVRILYRLDQFDGDLESNLTNGSLGDIDCEGVYASRGRSRVSNTRLVLRNAGAASGQWNLTKRTVVQCEAAFLLDGVDIEGDPNGDDAEYSMDCRSVTSVVVSGTNKTNVIRVRVRLNTFQVNQDGQCDLDEDAVITRLTTRSGSKTRVRRNKTLLVDTCEGDGDLDADDGTIELTGSISVRKVILRNKGRLRVGNGRNNGSTNRTSAILTTITSKTEISSDSVLEILGRAARFTGNATMSPGARLKVMMGLYDGFDPNGSIPLEFDELSCMFRNAAEITITIDACLLARFNNSFVLARWKTGSATFSTTVTVIVASCGSMGVRRRNRMLLQSGQQCTGQTVGNQYTIVCPSSQGVGATTGAPTVTTGTGVLMTTGTGVLTTPGGGGGGGNGSGTSRKGRPIAGLIIGAVAFVVVLALDL